RARVCVRSGIALHLIAKRVCCYGRYDLVSVIRVISVAADNRAENVDDLSDDNSVSWTRYAASCNPRGPRNQRGKRSNRETPAHILSWPDVHVVVIIVAFDDIEGRGGIVPRPSGCAMQKAVVFNHSAGSVVGVHEYLRRADKHVSGERVSTR